MKVQGPTIENKGSRGSRMSDAHKAALSKQNGKKSRAVRAANMKSDAKNRIHPNSGCISKKKRRFQAIISVAA